MLGIRSNWWVLRISSLTGGRQYLDLDQIANAPKCLQKYGNLIYSHGKVSQDCFYNYGKPLIFVLSGALKFCSSIFVLGTVLGTLLIITLIYLTILDPKLSWKRFIFNFFILLAPSTWYLLERGNIDSLIFIISVIATICLAKSKVNFSIILFSLCSVFKFYTFPILVVLCVWLFISRKNFFSLFVLVITTISIMRDITRITFIPTQRLMTFGILNPGLWINSYIRKFFNSTFELNRIEIYLIGFTFLAILVFFINGISQINNLQFGKFRIFENKEFFFLTLGSIHVINFVSGENNDYRLIFLSGTLVFFKHLELNGYFANLLYILAIISLWATCFFFGRNYDASISVLIQLLGNFAQYFVTATILAILYKFSVNRWNYFLKRTRQ